MPISELTTPSIDTRDPQAREALAIIQLLLADFHPRNFSVRMWDGTQWAAEVPTPHFTLILRQPRALRRLMQKAAGDLALCEGFIENEIDLDGDLEAAVPMADHLLSRKWSLGTRLRLAWMLSRLPKDLIPVTPDIPDSGDIPDSTGAPGRPRAELQGQPHSKERDRQAVSYHYDLSNDFYALWLDPSMVYSCAYFEHEDDELAVAQCAKLDLLCRKLQLQPGDRLLDMGCGWGGMLIHAAQHYGVNALGITLSQEQARLARERIAQAGLANRCRVEVRDYRELADLPDTRPFDKIVSVGMFEHVGQNRLPDYFRHAWNLLRPGGLFLNHGIARREIDPPSSRSGFILRHIFPDGELVPVNAALRHAEAAGFELRDVESLREHYALTLRHWSRRLQAQADRARPLVGNSTYRAWRLYLCGSAQAFAAGTLNVYQCLLLKPDKGRSGLPLTRAAWYPGKG